MVTPYTSAFLSGPGVTDITVQNQCIPDQSDHLEIASDPVAMADMLNALDPAHPVRCRAWPCSPSPVRSARSRPSDRECARPPGWHDQHLAAAAAEGLSARQKGANGGTETGRKSLPGTAPTAVH